MYEIAGNLETANNNLIRNANNKTSGLYASNFQKGNLSKYQTMSLIHNSAVSDIPLHFQGNWPSNLQVVLRSSVVRCHHRRPVEF